MAKNIVIIGNSAASTAAIETIRKYDQKVSIIQITDEPDMLYSRCLVPYYLSGGIDKNGLLFRLNGFHKNMKVDLHAGKRVMEVIPQKQQFKCDNGSTFNYDKLLITTGGSPQIPKNIPKNLKGIFVLRTFANGEAIKKVIPRTKNVVILGGGLIGMRIAYALSKCGLKVTVVIRSNRILSQMIDFGASQVLIKPLLENNIEIMTQTDIIEVQEKNNKLISVKMDNGEVKDCEMLIVAKGVNANTELIQNTDIKKHWGIITNEYMQTNYKNIFAAGDVAETFDIATEEYTINALWTCAVQQGHIAGLNLIEKTTSYDGSLGMNSLNFFDIPLISFGITSPRDESKYEVLVSDYPQQNIYKKIYIENNRIKGIILVGKIANAGILLSLIREKVDVSTFQHELLSDKFNFGSILKYKGKTELEKYYRIGMMQNKEKKLEYSKYE